MSAIRIDSVEEALSLFKQITEENFNPGLIEFGDWVSPKIYIPRPAVDSTVSSSYMEAFLVLQKEINRFAATVRFGAPHTRKLLPQDRRDLEILVRVSGGSSDLSPLTREPLVKFMNMMVEKFTGRQAAVVILGLAILLCGYFGFSAWLEQQKQIKLAELKSKEHIEHLSSMRFVTEEQFRLFKMILDRLEKQGKIGVHTQEFIDTIFYSFLGAAAKTENSIINYQSIYAEDAVALRVSARRKLDHRVLREKLRVVTMDTTEAIDEMVLMRIATGERYKMKLSETLFMPDDRIKLFEALESREELGVELSLKEVDGDVKSVVFLRVFSE